MHIAHPIRSVIPTLDAAVYEVLAGTTRAMTGREIHRLAGGSVRGVQLVLARMVGEGLVRHEAHSAATLYVANRDHLAWPAIEQLVRLRPELLRRITTEMQGWRPQPMHASIFGSFARKDGDSTSDVDVLVVRPDQASDEAWAEQVDTLSELVRAWSGNNCQVFDIDQRRIAEHIAARDPLVEAWVSEGVHLLGRPLSTVISDLDLRAPA